jgi:hypothetical protein
VPQFKQVTTAILIHSPLLSEAAHTKVFIAKVLTAEMRQGIK